MKRFLTIGVAALFLAGCGGGGSMSVPPGTGTAPSQTKSGARAVSTITKTYDYTLKIRPYPPGFSPPCQEVNPTIWLYSPSTGHAVWTDTSSQAGGLAPEINIGPSCGLAATGDHIHVLMEVRYGTPRFIAGNGNFKVDSVDDSHADLTITDYRTGVSSQLSVFVSW